MATFSIPGSESRGVINMVDNSDLEGQVIHLKSEVSSLKTELTEVTSLLKLLILENNRKIEVAPKVPDMTSSSNWPKEVGSPERNTQMDYNSEYHKRKETKKDKKPKKTSSTYKRQGKQGDSDNSSLDTRSSSNSGGGKDSDFGTESGHESRSIEDEVEEDCYHNSIDNNTFTSRKSSSDYGKAFHTFITRYSNGNRYKTESDPLDATQINQLKSSGTLVVMTVLFQLGRNFCTKKSAEYSDMYVNAVATEYFGCIPERVHDSPLGNSVLMCFPITPLFLLSFLDRSTEDLNSQQKWMRSKYRTNISEKIETLQLYRSKIAKLSQRLFGNTYKFYECKKWIEIFGQLLLFHLDRWNKAMCRNDLALL